VVGVRVRERVRRDLVAFDLAEDAAAGVAAGGVNEHVAEHVHVDRVGRKAAQHPHVGGQLLHGADPIRARRPSS
jgi:hypothetical protein